MRYWRGRFFANKKLTFASAVSLVSLARLHFKEIRTREENLTALKRSKDSLQSKIESQDKKVRPVLMTSWSQGRRELIWGGFGMEQAAKMKEENKDLPAALQRLAEMRQEMIGLENSVMNEDTKCVSRASFSHVSGGHC